jgi:hypothetical protein
VQAYEKDILKLKEEISIVVHQKDEAIQEMDKN